MRLDRRWRLGGSAALALNAALVAAIAIYLGAHSYPSSEVVRLRNALVIQPSSPADFSWIPPGYPADFARDTGPPVFAAEVAAIGVDRIQDDWGKAAAIAGHLLENAQDKERISSDLRTTYRMIRGGYGYCADFTDVFLALARAAGLDARMWAFSFDGFGGHGHAVNEYFDRQRGKWVMIDVYKNLRALDAATGEALGALELREAILEQRGPARFERIGPGRGYKHEYKQWEYYGRGVHQWYLWWGTAVERYDNQPLISAAERIAHPLAQSIAVALGLHPKVRVLSSPENSALEARMFSLRSTLLWLLPVGVVLVVLLIAQCLGAAYRRARGAAAASRL